MINFDKIDIYESLIILNEFMNYFEAVMYYNHKNIITVRNVLE